jgi:hypothetical protein
MMNSHLYGEIPKVRGVVVHIAVEDFRGRDRLDLREHVEYRPGDPDSRYATQRGVSLALDRLPQLLAFLHQVEHDALRQGRLKPQHYTRAGLTPPTSAETFPRPYPGEST